MRLEFRLRQGLQPGQGQPADRVLAEPAREQAEPQRATMVPPQGASGGTAGSAAPIASAARRRPAAVPAVGW